MRRIPWQLSLRYSRKGLVTVFGIALGVTFALVSFSIAQGLERDTLGIASNHRETTWVVSTADASAFAFHRLSAHPSALGITMRSGVDDEGRLRLAVALVGNNAPGVEARLAHPSGENDPTSSLKIRDRSLTVGARVVHPAIPPGAFLVDPEVIGQLTGFVDLALIDATSEDGARALRAEGLIVELAPGLEGFFRTSGVEIARDLLLVVIFASALAILFCYEFLRSEVRESRREIGIWRAVGMRARDVVMLMVVRAAAIGAVALAAGWGLSWFLLRAAHVRTGNAGLRFSLNPWEATIISGTFLVACVVGGLIPAWIAGRVTVREALEAVR